MSNDSLIRLICEADICGSRAVADGVAYNQYRVPGIENSPETMWRMIQGEDEPGVGGIYESGLKWKSHLYCYPMPRDTQSDGSTSASCTLGNIPTGMNVTLCGCL